MGSARGVAALRENKTYSALDPHPDPLPMAFIYLTDDHQ